MKKPRPSATYLSGSTETGAAVQRMARAIIAVKEVFTSNIFTLLKSQELNLEIVYANIRV